MAPDFTLQTFDGKPMSLAENLNGNPVLLVFWSYFCFPCQKELPELAQLARELGPDQLTVLGISLDGPQYEDKILPYMAQNAITFPNGYDRETEQFFEVAEHYGVVGTPTSFVLDPQGRVRFVHLGRLDPAAVAAVVRGAKDRSFCSEITKPQRSQ